MHSGVGRIRYDLGSVDLRRRGIFYVCDYLLPQKNIFLSLATDKLLSSTLCAQTLYQTGKKRDEGEEKYGTIQAEAEIQHLVWFIPWYGEEFLNSYKQTWESWVLCPERRPQNQKTQLTSSRFSPLRFLITLCHDPIPVIRLPECKKVPCPEGATEELGEILEMEWCTSATREGEFFFWFGGWDWQVWEQVWKREGSQNDGHSKRWDREPRWHDMCPPIVQQVEVQWTQNQEHTTYCSFMTYHRKHSCTATGLLIYNMS